MKICQPLPLLRTSLAIDKLYLDSPYDRNPTQCISCWSNHVQMQICSEHALGSRVPGGHKALG